MPERFGEEAEALDPAASDPLADLLFTLIAAVLPAILLLVPLTARTASAAHQERTARAEAVARAGATLHGVPVRAIVAGADGVRLGAASARLIAPDRLADDDGLKDVLARMRRSGEPLLLLIEPDGLETAFLLDPLLAANGPARIEEVRATERCGQTDSAPLLALCGPPP